MPQSTNQHRALSQEASNPRDEPYGDCTIGARGGSAMKRCNASDLQLAMTLQLMLQ